MVIVPCPDIAFASLVIVYSSNYQFLTIYFLLCPCPCRKIGYCQKLIGIYDIHLIQWYSIAIVRFASYFTHRNCITGFTVLLFFGFYLPKKNKLTRCFLLACYRFTLFQGCFNLCPAHHAICVLIYFSLTDTAARYFFNQKVKPCLGMTVSFARCFAWSSRKFAKTCTPSG